ncbi:MAG TPA: peptidase M28 family protein, partial [Vicinamibacteria bacterium]
MLSRALVASLVLASTPRLLTAEGSLSETYRETASRILAAAMADEEGFEKLGHLTTSIGNRL